MNKRTAQTSRVHAVPQEKQFDKPYFGPYVKNMVEQVQKGVVEKNEKLKEESKQQEGNLCSTETLQIQPMQAPQDQSIFKELQGDFLIRKEIGRGSYGVVFKAYAIIEKDEDEYGKRNSYAVKRIFPTINASFILIEMLILKLIEGKSNVTDLVNVYRLEGQVSLIFKYQKSTPFLSYLNSMSIEDIRCYMHQLLVAVKHLSEYGIMHRDIKPSNFLYDPLKKKGLLIDFGLSEIELDQNWRPLKHPENETVKKVANLQKTLKIKNRTGTKGYMAPEALFHCANQTTAVDIWACGVIFLSLLAKRHPIFSLNSSSKIKNFTLSNLIPLTCIFGSIKIKEISNQFGYACLIPEEFAKHQIDWKEICQIHDEDALNLLDQMLQLNPNQRITATEALSHPFFAAFQMEPKLN